jgi:hypothetical protein
MIHFHESFKQKNSKNTTSLVAEDLAEHLDNVDSLTHSSETDKEKVYCLVCRYEDNDAYSIRIHFENAHGKLIKATTL